MLSGSYLKTLLSHISNADPVNYNSAVFILHDQLNLAAWPDHISQEKPLLIFIESVEKGRSLPYHKQKLVYVLSSMRHFAVQCHHSGFPVLYLANRHHYDAVLTNVLKANRHLTLQYMAPSEWDSRKRLRFVKSTFKNRVDEIPNQFFTSDTENWADTIKKGYRMEYFYREMRRKTGYLMEGSEPTGSTWNYDEYNREKLPEDYPIPERHTYKPDAITLEVMKLVEEQFADHFGSLASFGYAVTREQALQQLARFINECLPDFGPFEDAMAFEKPNLFHSRLSMYLNNGLLLPLEVCDRAEAAFRENKAPLQSVEAFIRQIIGWREYIHIYYNTMMPEIRKANALNLNESLPELYWTGHTDMCCLEQSLKPVLSVGYTHHIPRLMVLSNFSNLTETDPRELNRWFWLAFVDAYEWVVLPNVLGMSTYADGGVLASKPYVSSGNYINKMSDYCKHCSYHISKKTGEDACPFNYLYWNFVDKHRDAFKKNGRTGFMVNMYEKKSEADKQAIRESSNKFLKKLKRER